MTTTDRTAIEELTGWAAGDDPRLCSDATLEQVRYLLLDLAGNALGGLAIESTRLVRDFASGRGGNVPTVGGQALLEEYAALVTGASAHALESDDTHQPSSSHPGAAVFPAALAIASDGGADARALAAAVTAGYEVMARVGEAATAIAQYDRGFHPTGTCGVFGAAVAAGRLLGLDAAGVRAAMGVALSFAAGSMEFLSDGAWTKRLHPGWAAHGGVIAARLAAAGYEAPRDPIGGPDGFLRAYSGVGDLSALTADLDSTEAQSLAIWRTSIKAHACCRYKQAPIDALLALVGEHDIAPDNIERIRIGVLEAGWDLIAAPEAAKRHPASVVDAQFSMPFGAAVAALRGAASVREYRPELIEEPAVVDLMQRVECYRSPDLDAMFPGRWPADVEVVLRDGRTVSARVETPRGDPENPLSWGELEDKFRALTDGVVTPRAQERVISAVRTLGAVDVASATPSEVVALLGAPEILESGV